MANHELFAYGKRLMKKTNEQIKDVHTMVMALAKAMGVIVHDG
jgi:hypothetical protein